MLVVVGQIGAEVVPLLYEKRKAAVTMNLGVQHHAMRKPIACAVPSIESAH
jgi:hypothetical protein